jgi:hypothetical protein
MSPTPKLIPGALEIQHINNMSFSGLNRPPGRLNRRFLA